MASKRDLVEAQTFSRRRLLTAFVSGAPGGQELEPTKPLRGAVTGVVLSVLLVVGSLAFGLLKPALKDGWNDNSLVVVKGDGSRYVAVKGTLYPVLNLTSARLVIAAASYHVEQVGKNDIVNSPRGVSIGIPGAPDALPSGDRLVATGWFSCVADTAATRTVLGTDAIEQIGTGPVVDAAAGGGSYGLLVSVAHETYLVADSRRHLIPAADVAAVERALGLDSTRPVEVPAAWLNLFGAGTDLAPITLADAGKRPPSVSGLPAGVVVGSVVEVTGTAASNARYVVDAAGDFAPLSALAAPLYALGSGALTGPVVKVAAADVARVQAAATAVAPVDWPIAVPAVVGAGDIPCARLTTGTEPHVDLVSIGHAAAPTGAVSQAIVVAPAGGALVRAASGASAPGPVLLVDQTGTAFPITDATPETLARLGYTPAQVTLVPPAWAALLPAGPALSQAGAAAQVGAAAGS